MPPPRAPRWPRVPAWLVDARGRTYRYHHETTAFTVMHQAREGDLWRLLRGADGSPLTLPRPVARAEVVAAVANVPGTYQLIPLSRDGKQRGDPPERFEVPGLASGAAGPIGAVEPRGRSLHPTSLRAQAAAPPSAPRGHVDDVGAGGGAPDTSAAEPENARS